MTILVEAEAQPQILRLRFEVSVDWPTLVAIAQALGLAAGYLSRLL